MVNPDTIPDGKFENLYCPECQAHPDSYEIKRDREGWSVLLHSYCKCSLNSAIEDEYVPTSVPPDGTFDERLFETS